MVLLLLLSLLLLVNVLPPLVNVGVGKLPTEPFHDAPRVRIVEHDGRRQGSSGRRLIVVEIVIEIVTEIVIEIMTLHVPACFEPCPQSALV